MTSCTTGCECRRAHPTLVVGFHLNDARGASAEEAQCPVCAAVAALPGEDAYPRRSPQAIGSEIPALRAQHFLQRDGKSGEIRHLGAGDETHGNPSGQAEQIG